MNKTMKDYLETMTFDEIIDVAHMYTALSLYLSPNYSTAKILMADILESREMYSDANKLYDSISNRKGYLCIKLTLNNQCMCTLLASVESV